MRAVTARPLDSGLLRTARAPGVAVPGYDRTAAVPSVVHIGPGVFHRGHQAVYADDVLATGSGTGAISCVSLRSSAVRDVLRAQDHLYTVLERDHARVRARLIGSIREAIVARHDPGDALARMVDPAVTVVTITVTEKGYCATASGGLDVSRPEIEHDIARPREPCSLAGLLLEALVRRRAAGVVPPTIVSCDNLPNNGAATRQVVTDLAEHRSGELAEWIRHNVSFPSSMVDRMVPATTDADRRMVRRLLGMADAWPVVSEPFSQWVVEDTFPAGRPPWERVGVELVPDVAPYEQAKLRILNAAHSALAYWGLLTGHRTIADAVGDPVLHSAVTGMLRDEVIPTLAVPPGWDLTSYTGQVLDRFANHPLGYPSAKVAADGSQKLPVRIAGTVRDRLAAGAATDRLAAVVAGYAACVLGPRAADFAVEDPELARVLGPHTPTSMDAQTAVDRLLPRVCGADVAASTPFRLAVCRAADAWWHDDVATALISEGRRD